MVSTSAKFALNKKIYKQKNPFLLAGMKHSIKNQFPLAGKLLPLLGIEKMEENWLTTNFKNCVHQQKKAPNISTKFVINRKPVSARQNEGFLEKCDFTGPKSCFHSNQYLEKI